MHISLSGKQDFFRENATFSSLQEISSISSLFLDQHNRIDIIDLGGSCLMKERRQHARPVSSIDNGGILKSEYSRRIGRISNQNIPVGPLVWVAVCCCAKAGGDAVCCAPAGFLMSPLVLSVFEFVRA